MKEFLGLGIGFSAIDKGITKSVTQLVKSLTGTIKKMGETEEAAAGKGKKEGGIFHGIVEGAKLMSLSKIGHTMQDMSEAMKGGGNSIQDTVEKLDTLRAKMSAVLDPKQANAYNSAMLKTMVNTGLTADETETLAQGMMDYGRSVADATASFPMMGEMVGKLGIDAGKVSEMWGSGLASLRATPGQIGDVIKETVRLQKAYHLTDQISNLPEIFATVTKNSAQFGKVNAAMALNTVRSVAGLSAAFQKVGMSQQKALATSTSFADKLASMKRGITDMQAGLEPMDDDIFKAAEAMSYMGISGEDAYNKILKGADDPKKFVEGLQGSFSKLDKETQNVVGSRLRRIFGDDAVSALQGYGDELQKSLAIDPKKAGLDSADAEYKKYTATLTNTFEVQNRLTESAKNYIDIATKFANKADIIKGLENQRRSYFKINKELQNQDSWLGKIWKWIDLYNTVGLSAFGQDFSDMAVWAERLGMLIFPLTSLIGLFSILGKGPIALVRGAFGLLGKSLGLLLKGLQALGPNGIGTTLKWFAGMIETIYVHVGVRLIDAFEKFKSVLNFIKSPLKAVGTIFRFFTGILSKVWSAVRWGLQIFTKLGPVMSILRTGVMTLIRLAITPLIGMMQALTAAFLATPVGWLVAGIVAIGLAIAAIVYYWDDIKAAMGKFWNWAGEKFDQFKTWFVEAFNIKGIAAYLAPVAKTVSDFLGGIFNPIIDWFGKMWDRIWESVPDSLKSMMAGAKKFISSVSDYLFGGKDNTITAEKKITTNTIPQNTDYNGNMPGATGGPNVIPMVQQPGVVAQPTFSSVATKKKESKDSDTQALIDEMHQVYETLLKLADAITDRPVKVVLEGDAKKFFRQSEREKNNAMGARGIGGGL